MTDFWRQPIRGYPVPFDPWANPGGCEFHEDVAERVCAYWEATFTLRQGKFEGKPFVLLDWQRQLVGHLFAWKRPWDKSPEYSLGTRRFRELFLYICKKAGKTELGAALGLMLLQADGEAGPEVYCCASSTEQAKLVYDAARDMMKYSKTLSRKLKGLYKAIKCESNSGYWRVLSSAAKTKDGPNVHGLLIDELHTFSDDELMDTLEAGTALRAQPLIIKTTTAAHSGESPCNRALDYARSVRDGRIEDPYYMPVIFDGQADYDADPEVWKDPKFWARVNPSLGVTVQPEYYEAEVRKCAALPSRANRVKRLHLNIQTDTVNTWLDTTHWAACAAPDPADPCWRVGPCYGGLDLASVTDIAALALYWPETLFLDVLLWVPSATVDTRAEYLIYHEAGCIMRTQGATIDYAFIRAEANRVHDEFDLQMIAYDRYNASHIVTEIADDDGIAMVEFRQGFLSMNAPSKEFERLITAEELCHCDNPCLNWMAGNAVVQTDPADNIKPVKPKRGSTKKVDGIIAAVMAVGLAMAGPTEETAQPFVVSI